MATSGSCINSGEALRETRNKTVHGFICTALVSSPNGYILYWGLRPPRVVNTRPYLVAIEPFRRVLYPAMLRRIVRVDCCPSARAERYCRLIADFLQAIFHARCEPDGLLPAVNQTIAGLRLTGQTGQSLQPQYAVLSPDRHSRSLHSPSHFSRPI
jgi:hypothetical protein